MKQHIHLIVGVLLVLWPGAGPVEAQSAYDLFQRAATAERVHGDLETAIDLYGQVVETSTSDRALAARALLQMGLCHETLGHERAEDAYSRILADFSDQTEVVKLARDRLAALSQPTASTTAPKQSATGPVATRLLSQDEMSVDNFYYMQPSPDGQRVAYSAIGTAEGSLFVRDLQTEETTRLAAPRFTLSPVWSPEGKKIAYVSAHFRETGVTEAAIRIVDLESQEIRELVPVANPKHDRVLDWSRDGTLLLTSLERADKTFSLVLVEVATGKRTPLISQGWLSSSTASFSPDGVYISFSAVEDGDQGIYVVAADGSTKTLLTSESGPESFPLWSPDGKTVVYQREDGAWALDVDDGRPAGAPRLLDSKPFDQPLAWSREGGFHYVAYNNVFGFHRLPVDPDKGEAAGPLERIDVDIEQSNRMAWSPDMKRLAFSGYDRKIHVVGAEDRSLRSFDLGNQVMTASSLAWSADGREVLFVPFRGGGGPTVKALDPSSGAIRDLFPTIDPAARFTISPDGKQMVYYRGEFGKRVLTLADVGEVQGRALAQDQDPDGVLSNWVRPAFSPDGTRVTFGRSRLDGAGDSLWMIRTDGTDLHKLASVRPELSKDGQGLETVLHAAVWSPSGRYLAYGDFRSLWVVDVETGVERELPLPADRGWLSVQQWSPDGRWISFGTQKTRHELWRVRNLVGPDVEPEQVARH